MCACVFAHTPVHAHGCACVCIHVCFAHTAVRAHGGLNVCHLSSSTTLYFFVRGGVSP